MSQAASTSDFLSKRLSQIFLCVAVVLLIISSVHAENITVCEEGCDYANITAGIAAAKSGNTLEVHSGIYRENVNVTKQLILRGIDTGKGRPVVDANQKGSAITLSADGIVVDGFEARTAVGNPFKEWAGIRIESNNNIISNNLAKNNDNGIFLIGFANNTISGNNATRNTNGIRVEKSNANYVIANYIAGNHYGLLLASSANNTLDGNRATDNDYGILLESSEGNELRNNLMYANSYNFGADGVNNVSIGNLVDNKPLYYLIGASGKIIDFSSQAGTVYCIDCTNVTIRDQILENNQDGIFLSNTTSSKLENNSLANNYYGIKLISSSKNVIRNNEINNSTVDALYLDSSDNNTIENNTAIQNRHYGINVLYSVGNAISMNNLSINYLGIRFEYSNDSLIAKNNLSFNKYVILIANSSSNNISLNRVRNASEGIWLISSSMNAIAGNDIIGNIHGLILDSSGNNTISKNKICENSYGIAFMRDYYNVIIDNIMFGNKEDQTELLDAKLPSIVAGPGRKILHPTKKEPKSNGEKIENKSTHD